MDWSGDFVRELLGAIVAVVGLLVGLRWTSRAKRKQTPTVLQIPDDLGYDLVVTTKDADGQEIHVLIEFKTYTTGPDAQPGATASLAGPDGSPLRQGSRFPDLNADQIADLIAASFNEARTRATSG